MARIVLWSVDKSSHADPAVDALIYKRGDVVDIMPDDWQPRPDDLAYPGLTVIDAPGVDPAAISSLLSSDPGDPANQLVYQRRAFSFDLDVWASGGRSVLRSANAVLALKKAKGQRKGANGGRPAGIPG